MGQSFFGIVSLYKQNQNWFMVLFERFTVTEVDFRYLRRNDLIDPPSVTLLILLSMRL